VETPLHDSFAATYVVHTHPAWVNGLTCALGGPEAAAELLPGALWIPYTDPGYTLCLRVRRAIEERRTGGTGEPQVVLLGNHGLFVAGNDEEEVRQGYAAVRAPLLRAYAAAGVPVALKIGRAPSPAAVARAGAVLREAFGAEAACLAAAGPCELAAGPLSPDHIVYARAYPYEGALQPTALRAFRARRGYPPRVVIASDAVYGVGPTERVANLALELALDGARVRHLARAFGGAQYLSDVSRAFIEEWEVESYRSRQV
jgi:rhamnose utilization protein RhaD (predicted bifunctional aldolase and dehydrogenase)